MGNNFQSLQHFLPELILIFTILFVIIADLIPSLKKYSFNLTLVGLVLVGFMMFILGPGDKLIFETMLMDDLFSFYFKSGFLKSALTLVQITLFLQVGLE